MTIQVHDCRGESRVIKCPTSGPLVRNKCCYECCLFYRKLKHSFGSQEEPQSFERKAPIELPKSDASPPTSPPFQPPPRPPVQDEEEEEDNEEWETQAPRQPPQPVSYSHMFQ